LSYIETMNFHRRDNQIVGLQKMFNNVIPIKLVMKCSDHLFVNRNETLFMVLQTNAKG
jgi:hypothetical protein